MASRTQKMIFATGEPAWAVNREGIIVAWNAAASRVLGHTNARALGSKCWELLGGQDAFGNQYCCSHCPMREMASRSKSVNRCEMFFHTADDYLQRFTVTTLVLFHSADALLIHLCCKNPRADCEHTELASTPTTRTVTGPGILTRREREVLTYLSDGHSTRDIATLLSISVRTVRNHIEHILHKLNVHSRLEAVAVSRRLGLH